MSITRSLMALTTASLLCACDAGRSFVEPTAIATDAAVASSPSSAGSTEVVTTRASVPILDGTWTWSEEVITAVPPFLAQIFGAVPEGPMTHMRCQSSGVMTIEQVGVTFTGQTTQQSTCETRGGQVFSPPAFPGGFDIVDGRIMGNSFRMLFGAPADVVPAPYTGTVASRVDGVAVELRATGRVITPGHPQNPLGFDPPPSPNHTVSWQAIRVGPPAI